MHHVLDHDGPPTLSSDNQSFVHNLHVDMTIFTCRNDYWRALCEDPEVIENWFQLIQDTIMKYRIDESDIWNFDETGFMMGVISPVIVVTTLDRQGRAKMKQSGNQKWATVIQDVNSYGWAMPPFIIVFSKNHLTFWYCNTTLPDNWVVPLSANGWTTNEISLERIKHFNKHTSNCTKGAYCLLVLDGHESHQSASFQCYCKENKIVTLCMPAHSSHLLQPLDVGCFGPLK